MEAGGETAWIHECLTELGADVVVVNPNKVKLIAETRRKTDKLDARVLCDLLRVGALPQPVHMPSAEARVIRGLLTARRQLIRSRTSLMARCRTRMTPLATGSRAFVARGRADAVQQLRR